MLNSLHANSYLHHTMTTLHVKPLIKKIKTTRCHYIYDTWTNEILEVDNVVFGILPDNHPEINFSPKFTNAEYKRAVKEIDEAKFAGFFQEDYPTIESFPEEHLSDLVNHAVHEGPEHMILNISEQCNLRCRYCIYSGAYDFDRTHSQRAMSWEVAKQALDRYFSSIGRKDFSIGFYGGEPLIAFHMIQRIVAYAKKQRGKTVRFNLTTNGTLFTEEVLRFIIREGFNITISIDGPDWIHDRYRVFRNGRGTFSRVWKGILRLRELDEQFFSNHVSFSMVLVPPVDLKAINKFIEQHPALFNDNSIMISSVNVQSSKVWGKLGVERSYRRTSKEQLDVAEVLREFKHYLWKAGKPSGFPRWYNEREYVTVHQRPMTLMPKKTASHGQCIPGKRKCFVDTDGDLYMCEKVTPAYKIGNVRSGIDVNRVKDFLRAYNRFFRDQCCQCWAVRLCEKCYNNIRDGEEWSMARRQAFCVSQRERLHQLLTQYCDIREQKDNAFQWAEEIEIL